MENRNPYKLMSDEELSNKAGDALETLYHHPAGFTPDNRELFEELKKRFDEFKSFQI